MDIRHWNANQIMQLPDFCFGERFVVSTIGYASTGLGNFDISEKVLPERCVLWELCVTNLIYANPDDKQGVHIIIRLSNTLDTNSTIFYARDELLPEFGAFVSGHRSIRGLIHLTNLRVFVNSKNRKIETYTVNDGEATAKHQISFVFSAVPDEVPDWLVNPQNISKS